MDDRSVRIDITGKVAFSEEISVTTAAQIIAFVSSGSPGLHEAHRLADSSSGLSASEGDSAKVENARAALDISGAQRNPEKIVALGAYVLEDGGETFKAEDVKTQFRRAREAAPANFSRDLSAAIAAGWIAEAEPGEYYLTNKVAGVLDGGFAFPKGANGARSRASRKGAAKAESPESLTGIDEFFATLDGYPAYSKMKSQKDRLLWVALYMREIHGRNGVTNKEIAYISDRIGVGIPSNNITAAFKSAKTPGFAVRSTQDHSIRVTDDGVDHLASLADGTGAA